ncbi:MAG: YbaB/EbfC family nucleoid-associated protein [Actinomycetota bacterium]|nr:YbaB/EbfC family nucleoid-associated protein [Actinomycetota bacterium]
MNYGNMMKQAKMMQKKMQQIQEELKKTEFDASAGGGAIKVKVNGEQEVLEVKINKEMVDAEDLEMVEDMVVVAINDAISQSKQKMQEEMGSLTGGLNIPGLF